MVAGALGASSFSSSDHSGLFSPSPLIPVRSLAKPDASAPSRPTIPAVLKPGGSEAGAAAGVGAARAGIGAVSGGFFAAASIFVRLLAIATANAFPWDMVGEVDAISSINQRVLILC